MKQNADCKLTLQQELQSYLQKRSTGGSLPPMSVMIDFHAKHSPLPSTRKLDGDAAYSRWRTACRGQLRRIRALQAEIDDYYNIFETRPAPRLAFPKGMRQDILADINSGLDICQLGHKYGQDPRRINNLFKLCELTPDAKAAYIVGWLTLQQAVALVGASEAEQLAAVQAAKPVEDLTDPFRHFAEPPPPQALCDKPYDYKLKHRLFCREWNRRKKQNDKK